MMKATSWQSSFQIEKNPGKRMLFSGQGLFLDYPQKSRVTERLYASK